MVAGFSPERSNAHAMTQHIQLGGSLITWDDIWHCLEVNGLLFHLSPTQYRVCRAFLTASQIKNSPLTQELVLLAYLRREDVLKETHVPLSGLRTHIYNLNARLATSGLHLSFFRAGYLLTFSPKPFEKRHQTNEGEVDHHSRESIFRERPSPHRGA